MDYDTKRVLADLRSELQSIFTQIGERFEHDEKAISDVLLAREQDIRFLNDKVDTLTRLVSEFAKTVADRFNEDSYTYKDPQVPEDNLLN